MAGAEQWRDMIKSIASQYDGTPGGAPPYPLVEAQVDLESGGDPSTYDPGGASGLGQIIVGGLEYDAYENNPGLVAKYGTTPNLFDPRVNLEIMVYGLDQREESGLRELQAGNPGAYADWYMTSAGYLGGADQSGFNSAADSYGTTGQSYVLHLRKYIERVFGFATANSIDELQPGEVKVQGRPHIAPWSTVNDPSLLTFDPNVPGGGTGLIDGLVNNLPGVATVTDAVSGIQSLLSAVSSFVSALPKYAARIGLFVLGAVLLILGLKVSL